MVGRDYKIDVSTQCITTHMYVYLSMELAMGGGGAGYGEILKKTGTYYTTAWGGGRGGTTWP